MSTLTPCSRFPEDAHDDNKENGAKKRESNTEDIPMAISTDGSGSSCSSRADDSSTYAPNSTSSTKRKETLVSESRRKMVTASSSPPSSCWSIWNLTESLSRVFCPTIDEEKESTERNCPDEIQTSRVAPPTDQSSSVFSVTSSCNCFFPCTNGVDVREVSSACATVCTSCSRQSSYVFRTSADLLCNRHDMQQDMQRTRNLLERDIAKVLGSTSKEALRWLRSIQTLCNNMECFRGDAVGHHQAPRLLLLRQGSGRKPLELPSLRHRISGGRDAQALRAKNLKMNLDPSHLPSQGTTCHVGAVEPVSASCDEMDVSTRPLHQGPLENRVDDDEARSCTSTQTSKSLYYDSDPGECAACHKGNPRRKQPTRPMNVRNTDISDARSLADPSFDNMYETLSYNGQLDVYDDQMVAGSINYLTNGQTVLVWHPTLMKKKEGQNIIQCHNPVRVKAWIERGSRLKANKVLHPKFMWKRESEQHSVLDRRRKKNKKRSKSPYWIDMLGILRILKPTAKDQEFYPLAKLKYSFTVTAHTNEVFLFESSTERERDKVMNSLKLAVARLTSKIMMGATDVLDEFYTPWSLATISMPKEYCRTAHTSKNTAAPTFEGATTKAEAHDVYYPTYDGVDLWKGPQ